MSLSVNKMFLLFRDSMRTYKANVNFSEKVEEMQKMKHCLRPSSIIYETNEEGTLGLFIGITFRTPNKVFLDINNRSDCAALPCFNVDFQFQNSVLEVEGKKRRLKALGRCRQHVNTVAILEEKQQLQHVRRGRSSNAKIHEPLSGMEAFYPSDLLKRERSEKKKKSFAVDATLPSIQSSSSFVQRLIIEPVFVQHVALRCSEDGRARRTSIDCVRWCLCGLSCHVHADCESCDIITGPDSLVFVAGPHEDIAGLPQLCHSGLETMGILGGFDAMQQLFEKRADASQGNTISSLLICIGNEPV
ncbi:hypothetical protein D9C73_000574 [Collichthys lucidus]|uniref:Uncharacterized protein n=1 Tax=Collichthys lucidus TaxID=240159 RepID=A0A4U5TXV3_COLLU|nr:hypothetical protein D9C73_000574 [Collichthys lucidus]